MQQTLPKDAKRKMHGFPILPRTVRRMLLLTALCFAASAAQAQTFTGLLSFEFGKVAVNSAGSVILATISNTRTKTGGVVLVAGNQIRRGRVVVNGPVNASITITPPASVIVTGSNGGSGTLVITVNGGTSQTLSASGTRTIRFGGTLSFAGPVPAGTFTANVPIDISL
jgi:hypothetical protein